MSWNLGPKPAASEDAVPSAFTNKGRALAKQVLYELTALHGNLYNPNSPHTASMRATTSGDMRKDAGQGR